MRGSIFLALVASAYLSAVAALPWPGLALRVTMSDGHKKPIYSVVPLEPGNGNGGGSNGDDGDGEGTVTVIETVVKTQTPVTITRSAKPSTITRTLPTTVSIVGSSGEVTGTVTVSPKSTAQPITKQTTIAAPSSEPTTASRPTTPPVSPGTTILTKPTAVSSPGTIPTSLAVPSLGSSSTSQESSKTPITAIITRATPTIIQPTSPSIVASSSPATTAEPSAVATFSTIYTSSSSTFDNGQWHTTYPQWSETVARHFQHSRS